MRSVAAALLVLALAPRAAAQDCDCDHQVPLDQRMFHGGDEGVRPGDRICVMAGERPFLRFRQVQGTEAERVEIVNCGGRAVIRNTDRAYALVFEEDSRHFHLSGAPRAPGDPEYGFDISAPDTEPYPGVGLWLLGRSTDYEVDHLEIHDTGFAGVSAKTDPLCDGSADQDVFVQRNIALHHLWIHDVGGEGFYIGSTQSDGHRITCDGTPEVRQPHFLDGVELHHNLVENTGWDGAQIGMARTGCRVHHNVIRHVGLAREMYQMQGLQIGTYSACEVWANHLEDGPAMGIIVLGADDTFIHDNVIVGFTMADGIYANHRDVIPGARYRFDFNTIVGWDRAGITVFGGMLGASEAIGNLLVGAGAGVGAGRDVDWTEDGNVVVAAVDEAGFVGAGDYHLRADSPARGAAIAVPELTRDFDGYPRADPPSAGAFEYVDPTVDAGVIGADAGAPPPPPRDGGPLGPAGDASLGTPSGPVDDAGCGCRAAGAPRDAPAPVLSVLAVAALAYGRRRRSVARRLR